jgi:outer membrane protein OmpA-like peptidoglycan-associated protein
MTMAGLNAQTDSDFKTYSKFDFIPGEEVLFYDNFASGEVGDFPASWNTNGSGELVTVSNTEGKWLRLSSEIGYRPQLNIKAFPENYTIEFDAIVTTDHTESTNYIELDVFNASNAYQFFGREGSGAGISVQASTIVANNWLDAGPAGLESVIEKKTYTGKARKVIHFALWVQKERGRLYMDQEKVVDIPLFIPSGVMCNALSISPGIYSEEDNIYISNLRVAVGAPDMRSKLITEGKLVTRGIQFDVNSDKIKSTSYGTLKEIAQVLKDNPDVKVKIVGHTDSNGTDEANLDLSKRRANSVKATLTKDFGIDASRMEPEGKGESEPLSPNTSSQGMANNRRVEFIKL